MRAAIQIVGCAVTAVPTAGLGCAAISSGMALAAGGSLVDALMAGAFAFAQMGVWNYVGLGLQAVGVVIEQGAAFAANAGAALIKAAVHGVVGGAMALAEGGEFLQGFAANAIGAIGGSLGVGAFGDVGGLGGLIARTTTAAIAGCSAASLSGGKCANGAVTAAMAHLFNQESAYMRKDPFADPCDLSPGLQFVCGGGGGRSVSDGGGRAGRQPRLRDLANDDKLGSADKGWIRQELNSIERGQRSSIRNPPGKDLAHERGREAAKGYDHSNSNLQDRTLHRLQHRYDDFGRKNRERPR